MYNRQTPRPADGGNPMQLANTLRKLWTQHVMWTRSFIISTAAALGDLQPVTDRLLRNPADFADRLRPYYGYDKAKNFETLLTDHLMIGAKLINDTRAGDAHAIDYDRNDWYQNADDIANLLSGLNPYWNRQQWQRLLYDHLRMTEDEAVYRLNAQYAADIAKYDEIEDQALRMADDMAEGMRRQFRL